MLDRDRERREAIHDEFKRLLFDVVVGRTLKPTGAVRRIAPKPEYCDIGLALGFEQLRLGVGDLDRVVFDTVCQQPIAVTVAPCPHGAPIVEERVAIFLVLEVAGVLERTARLPIVGKPDVAIVVNGDRAAKHLTRAFPDRLAEQAILAERVADPASGRLSGQLRP